jgi:hypothetical protein
MRRRRLLVSLVVMALVGGVAPTVAGAAWTAPATLSAAGQKALDPQVAVDANGNAVFTWRRFDGTNWRVQARARSAAGALGALQTLSAAGQNANSSQVAVDTQGDAVFTWRRFDGTNWRVQARARSAAGVLSPVQNLSAPGQNGFGPQVAVDADGDAVFTWQRPDGTQWRIQARGRSAAGALSPVQNLSAAGQNASSPQVGIAPNGKAVFTWAHLVPISQGCCRQIEARARSAAGALSAIQTLSPPPGPNHLTAHSSPVAVDAHGNAVFVWTLQESSGHTYGRAQARARSAAGALSPVQNVSPQGYCCGIQVAVDPAGNAVFSWTWSSYYLESTSVLVRGRSAAGALSPAQNLTDKAGDAQGGFGSQVGVDATGQAVITWISWGDAPPPDYGAVYEGVQVQVRSAAGALGPLQTLSPTGYEPEVAVNGAGDAVVAWRDTGGTNNSVIQAAAGP